MGWARWLQVGTWVGQMATQQALEACFGRRASDACGVGGVCARASGAVAGSKPQPINGLRLAHSHVDQAQGAELLCARVGVARQPTAAGAVVATMGGLGLMWLPCGRVWTV